MGPGSAKALWKSKTFWTGFVALCAGLVQAFFQGDEFSWPGIQGLFNTNVLVGLAAIFGRDALRKFQVSLEEVFRK